MEMLLTVIVTWLSINFALPATRASTGKISDRVQMFAVRAAALPDKEARQAAAQGLFDGHNFHALYDDAGAIPFISAKKRLQHAGRYLFLSGWCIICRARAASSMSAEARERLAHRGAGAVAKFLGTTLEADSKSTR